MLSFFPRGVLDEILNLIESVSEGFPSYSLRQVLLDNILPFCEPTLDTLLYGNSELSGTEHKLIFLHHKSLL